MHTKILVTGGFGVLGRLFYAQLHKDYDIYLLDRARDQSERIIIDNAQNHWSLPNIPDDHYFECDILDHEKLRECLKGIDIVVHLAALLENQNPKRIELVNVRGTENVLNACKENGIRKILYASSVMVMYYHRETPVINSIFTQTVGSHDIPKLKAEDAVPCTKDIINKYFAPNDVEGVYSYIGSKLKCESLVNDFVKEQNDRSAVIMRLGWVNVMNNPYVEENPCGDESCVWMSQRDAQQFLQKCTEYVIKHQSSCSTYFGLSNNDTNWLDIDTARTELGYEPQDKAEDLKKVVN
jgi:nucleoside-diphosphate-sugar epimerase